MIWKSIPIFNGAKHRARPPLQDRGTTMKTTYTITMASALLLAAGCAQEERSVRTGETDYSSGRMSEYNNQSPATAVGGSYAPDGSYSSGGGGTYASRPDGNYSGTVGADGTYTPYANADASTAAAPVGGYAGSAGTESDNAVVAQVRESLRQDPETAMIVPNLQISARNGAVILNGHVQSEEQKNRIFSKVLGVTGVVAVNNQLNVMAGGTSVNGENSKGPPLYPTGNNSGSPRLYRDANGQDTSTNNTLNSTPQQNGQTPLYQQSNPGGTLNPTSRQNGSSPIYQNNPGEKSQNQDTNNVQNNLQNQ
jgi:osmotically-inducible protein OsmY